MTWAWKTLNNDIFINLWKKTCCTLLIQQNDTLWCSEMSTSGNIAMWTSSSIMHRHFFIKPWTLFSHPTSKQAWERETRTIMIFFNFMSHTIAWVEKAFQLTGTTVKTVICKQTGRNLVWFTVLLALPAILSHQTGRAARYLCTDSLNTFDFIPQQFL